MRAKLTIGAKGQVAVPVQQADSLGLADGGEVELVTVRGAFALVVPVHADAPQPAFFAGSLSSLTVPEIVQFIIASLKTGVLLLAFGSEAERQVRPDGPERLRRKTIYFRDGQVVFASSTDPADRLGPVLARSGVVSAEDLERCAKLVQSGRPLGQVLVDDGAITPGQLYEAIAAQVREIFLSAFLETSGDFAFLDGAKDQANEVKLPERTRELVLEGMKRFEEAELRRAAEASDASPPEVVIEVEMPALTPPPVPGARPRVKLPRSVGPFETYRRIFKRVYGALARAEPDAATRLNSWFERLPEKRRAAFEGVRIAEDGDMDVAQILVNVESTGEYQGAAARARSLEALEELLAFALFEAKNRLPKAEAERLLRDVGKMQVGKA